MTILIDRSATEVKVGERLIDVIGRAGIELPHVCYHPQLGPIQTCDTCMVEVDDYTNPFYRYDPDQCILWAAAPFVEAPE